MPSDRKNLQRLDGKSAVITGATGGIGEATAKLFLDLGAKVMLVGRNGDKLAETCARLGEGANCSTAIADSTDEAAIAAAVKATLQQFGSLDILELRTYEAELDDRQQAPERASVQSPDPQFAWLRGDPVGAGQCLGEVIGESDPFQRRKVVDTGGAEDAQQRGVGRDEPQPAVDRPHAERRMPEKRRFRVVSGRCRVRKRG